MIVTQVVIKDDITPALDQFGAQMPKLLDTVLRIVGYRYRAHIKKNYLSGQMLGIETGQTIQSLVVGKRRGAKHIYIVGSRKVTSRQDFGGVALRRTNTEGVKLANIFEHQGGYVIEPKKAKALIIPVASGIYFAKRVEGRARPFMTQSAQTFSWGPTIEKTVLEVVEKQLKKELAASKPTKEWSEADGVAAGPA